MKRIPHITVRNQPAARRGFTLVEMLVAVALVVLMMSMFAEIFSLAAGSISTQRGIAENDQAARTLTTVIRGDLNNRTYRTVVPFFFAERQENAPIPFGERQGFISISENDPLDDTDDVLHLTVYDKDDPYYGKAAALMPMLGANPNQPEADDGQVIPDGTSSSPAAEVVYFLRNGNLYRRVLLIRNPLSLDGAERQPQTRGGSPGPEGFFDTTPTFKVYDMNLGYPPDPTNPTIVGADGNPGNDGIDDDNDGSTDERDEIGWPGSDDLDGSDNDDFWRHFDFSAYYAANGAQFNGQDLLNNSLNNAQNPALGQPHRRFGHNHASGQPREFDSAGRFFGRFTQEESSHPFFNYPQRFSEDFLNDPGTPLGTNGNPMDPGDMDIELQNGIMTYVGGGVPDFAFSKSHEAYVQSQLDLAGDPRVPGVNRRAEDILLSNVHAFDLEVWDDDLQRFVDIGHSDANGDFTGPPTAGPIPPGSISQNLNPGYGGFHGNRFDTWHPFDASQPPQPPFPGGPHTPYRVMFYHPPDRDHQHSFVNDPTAPQLFSDFPEPVPGSRTMSAGEAIFAPNHRGFAFYWRCTFARQLQIANPADPFWNASGDVVPGATNLSGEVLQSHFPPAENTIDLNPMAPGGGQSLDYFEHDANNDGVFDISDPNEDRNQNGFQDDMRFVADYNYLPLKAIRITVRFLHVGTGQMRQLTLVHAL